MKLNLSQQQIVDQARAYLQRVERGDDHALSYPRDEKAIYKIVSGSLGDFGTSEDIALVEGRFIDAVVFAVQQENFCGSWNSDPGNINAGYVVKAKIAKLEELATAKLI
ncbi:MAG TPA: hypothetical protein VI612_00740 [Candidatus Nanoarchaeia archaeon]|nr:hypothetical protein [Candidatus Nanoarchaeia archaeon]